MLRGVASTGSSGSSGITIDSSVITGGTSGRVLFDNAGTTGEFTGLTITTGALATITTSGIADFYGKRFSVTAAGGFVWNNGVLGFSSTGTSDGAPDTGISRGAANTLWIGNGTQDASATVLLASLKASSLTATGIVYAGTAGLLTTDTTRLALTASTLNIGGPGAMTTGMVSLKDTLFSGTSSPFNFISFYGADNARIGFTGMSAGDFYIGNTISTGNVIVYAGNAEKMQVYAAAAQGASITDPANTSAFKFLSFVSNAVEAGNIIRVAQTAAVTFTSTSDGSLKNVFGDSDRQAATDRLMAYRMRDYEWKSQPGLMFRGPIAQEAYAVNKEPMLAFPGNNKDSWKINMAGFVPDLIMAVQALRTEVNQLKGI